MKILLFLLFCLSPFLEAFEAKKLYQCASKYRLVNGSPHEFSLEEQQKSLFQFVLNKKKTRLRTSDGMIYTKMKSRVKGDLYVSQVKVNGRALTYKLKMASGNGLYKSVTVTGYGDLINEFVLCAKIKETSKKSNDVLKEETTSKDATVLKKESEP